MLERNLAEDRSLRLSRHAFFGLDGCVQTGGPAAVECDPALELVHHLDGAVLDDVVDIAMEQGVSVQRLVDGRVDRLVGFVEETAACQGGLDGVDSGVGERDVVAAGIDREVLAGE